MHTPFRRCICLLVLFLLLPLFTGHSLAQTPAPQQTAIADLSEASLEQLMNVDVTIASKKEQHLSHVAAAIYVLNQEDIRRSAATNIPDLLRMVPGLDVAQASGHSWAISARGFNNIWANKLLVLIDGRSVYNPALSGTLWDTQDVPLPDIERIEIIRGPGATVWGANAVNGVINIITKNSSDTAGGLIDIAAGSQLAEQSLAQYGGSIGSNGHYRLFGGSTLDRANLQNNLGQSANDPGRIYHFGFRSDWSLSDRDSLLVEGDLASSNATHIYDGFYSLQAPFMASFLDAASSHVGSVLGRWTRTLSLTSDFELQFYFDHSQYANYGVHERNTTGDFDFKHHFALGSRNDIVWGLDARLQPSTISGGYAATFSHPSHTDWLAGGFAQDEIRLSDKFWLTLGTKLEHNGYTGASVQPTIRALWAPTKRQSVWAAVSRALREPSREDVDVRIIPWASTLDSGLTALIVQTGNPAIKEEELLAYEAGYRFEPNKTLSLDLSLFDNHYNHLISARTAGNPYLSLESGVPALIIPQTFGNAVNGHTYGGELSATVNLFKRWKLTPGYALLRSRLTPDRSVLIQGDAPHHQFQLRSAINLRPNVQLDTSAFYVSRLDDQSIPAYVRVNARLGWRLSDSFELSVVGENLVDNHLEFGTYSSTLELTTYIGRSAYLRGTWHF